MGWGCLGGTDFSKGGCNRFNRAAASSGRRRSPETRTTSNRTKLELEGLQYMGSKLVVAIVDLQARLHGRPAVF